VSKPSASERAARRIREIISTHGDYLPASGVDIFAIRDLLTDVRHFCDHANLNFPEALDSSYDVYFEERAGHWDSNLPSTTPAS
jgi:hypothetical protein